MKLENGRRKNGVCCIMLRLGGGVLAMFAYGGVRVMFLGLKFHLKAIFLGLKFSNMNVPFFGAKKFSQFSQFSLYFVVLASNIKSNFTFENV